MMNARLDGGTNNKEKLPQEIYRLLQLMSFLMFIDSWDYGIKNRLSKEGYKTDL